MVYENYTDYLIDTEDEKADLDQMLADAVAEERPIEEIKQIIDEGANIHVTDMFGASLLMQARTAEQTKFFIDAGLDVNAKNEDGETALMTAQTAEQTKLLIEAGVDVNVKDDYGATALMRAKTAEQTKLLIEAGADVNARNKNGETALMHAQTAEQMKLLIEAGADVNAKDGNGADALACYLTENTIALEDGSISFRGEPEAVKLLATVGADVDGTVFIGQEYSHTECSIKAILSTIDDPEIEKQLHDPRCIRKHIEERKANIKKSRLVRQKIREEHPEEKVSGVALADEIAKYKISGKEKRTITPGVALDIKRKKSMEK